MKIELCNSKHGFETSGMTDGTVQQGNKQNQTCFMAFNCIWWTYVIEQKKHNEAQAFVLTEE
jgi:hypothetical protein